MINILVTLNANYLHPLKVLLKSLFHHNPKEKFSIYLMHSNLNQYDLDGLHQFITEHQHQFYSIFIDRDYFKEAPVFRHYSTEMYYRLAAHEFLPKTIDRVLYLDPDIVTINPIGSFYRTNFENNLFIASEHEFPTKIVQPINKIRLKTPLTKGYFNTGVLLMNVALMRDLVHLDVIYQYIEKNKFKLVLPDQDVLNALYWDKIKPVDSYRYNYDARYFEFAKFYQSDKNNLEWIKKHTLFIHYCGKDKPWHDDYKGKLGVFYQKFEQMI